MAGPVPATPTAEPCFAVVVPPENPTVEHEMRVLLPDDVRLVTTRLPVCDGDLEQRLQAYNASLEQAGAAFGGMPLDAIYLACTGSSYLVGPHRDADLADQMAVSGAAPLTAARAILDTMEELGRSRVLLVSPYPDWLTARAARFWQDASLTVESMTKVAASDGIYSIGPAEVTKMLRTIEVGPADIVLLSGTGMPTVDSIADIGRELEVPVISSSVAAARQLCRRHDVTGGLAHDLIDMWL